MPAGKPKAFITPWKRYFIKLLQCQKGMWVGKVTWDGLGSWTRIQGWSIQGCSLNPSCPLTPVKLWGTETVRHCRGSCGRDHCLLECCQGGSKEYRAAGPGDGRSPVYDDSHPWGWCAWHLLTHTNSLSITNPTLSEPSSSSHPGPRPMTKDRQMLEPNKVVRCFFLGSEPHLSGWPHVINRRAAKKVGWPKKRISERKLLVPRTSPCHVPVPVEAGCSHAPDYLKNAPQVVFDTCDKDSSWPLSCFTPRA